MTSTAGREHQASHDKDLRQLARQGGLNLAGSVVAASMNLVLPILVTRNFDRDEAGVFFQAIAVFFVVIGVGVMGSDTGLVRHLPRAIAQRSLPDVRLGLRTALVPPFLLTMALAAFLVLYAAPLGRLVVGDENGLDGEFAAAFTVLAVTAPLVVVYLLGLAASRGLGSVFPLVVIDKIGRGLVQVLCCAGVIAIGSSVLVLVFAWVVPYAAALLVLGVWFVRRMRRLTHHLGRVGDVPTPGLVRDYWAFTGPRAVSKVLAVALQRLDIVLVGALRGPEDAALYAAATRFPILGLMFVQAIQQVMSPRISEFLALGARSRATTMFQTTTAWLVLVSWPVYLVSAVFAPLLLDVFGAGYDAAVSAVVILCLVMLLATACGPVDAVLLMGGRSGLSLINTAFALVVMLAIDVLLIPPYGVTGAAIGWGAAIAVNNLLPLWQVHRSLHMHPVGVATMHAVPLALATGVVAVACRLIGGDGLVSLLLAVLLGGALFVAGLVRFREPLDLDAMITVLRRRRRRRRAVASGRADEEGLEGSESTNGPPRPREETRP